MLMQTEPAPAPAPEPLLLPASPAQERFWLLDRLESGNAALNVAAAWRLAGPIDAERLDRAWRHLIRRHEVLRTVFREVDGRLLQDVRPQSSFRLAEIDLRHLPAPARAEETRRIAEIEARTPLDLADGPLLRVTLLRDAEHTATLVLVTHQIVCDGWSLAVIRRELAIIEAALAAGEPIPLDELPLQYADYAEWLLAAAAERDDTADLAYWSRQLDGLRPLTLPPDRPPVGLPSAAAAIVSTTLPPALIAEARRLAAERGATLFAAALAALTGALHRVSGETDIGIALLVADRDQPELHGLIGQFVNALVLRNDLSGDPAFGALVERLRDSVAAALDHRSVPIETLLSLLRRGRRDTEAVSLPINFIFQPAFEAPTTPGALQIDELPSLPSDTLYDLNVFMAERADGHWTLACQYRAEHYEAATIERLLGYIRRLLEAGCAAPAQPLSALPMLAASERAALLADPELHEAPAALGIPARLAAQLAAQPGAIALIGDGRQWSRRNVDTEVTRLAAHFAAHGVSAGLRVGLDPGAAGPTLDLPIALLALLCLDAEAWLLPADADALAVALAEARLDAVCGPLRGPVPAGLRQVPLHAETQTPGLGAAPAPALAATVTTPARAAACAVWTPGADGRPAWLRLDAVTLERRLLGLAKRPGLRAGDTVIATPAPDGTAVLLDRLLPLLIGATVVIADRAAQTSADRLSVLLREQPSPLLIGPLSAFSGLLDAAAGTLPSGLRLWLRPEPTAADEAWVRRWLAAGARLWALTELPGLVLPFAVRPLTAGSPAASGRSLVPLPGVALRVLDAAGALAPTGRAGNLHLGGLITAAADDPRRFLRHDAGSGPWLMTPLGVRRLADGRWLRLDDAPAATAGASPAPPAGADAPLDAALAQRLIAIWSEVLGRDDLDADSHFFEAGGHSLLAARMLGRVEQQFGRRIGLVALFQAPTLRQFAAVLGRDDARSFDFRQVIRLQPNGSRPPLIAINNTGIYYGLARRLGEDQPVTSLQLFDPAAGLAALPTSIEAIATEYVRLIERVQPKGPYRLLGWCVAGTLAYEVARQLSASGRVVDNLYLMDAWVPNYVEQLPPLQRLINGQTLRLTYVLNDLRRQWASGRSLGTFLGNRAFVQRLLRAIGRKGAAPESAPATAMPDQGAPPEHYDLWLLDYLQRLSRQYTPLPYAGRITLFRSRREPVGLWFDPFAGWRRHATGDIRLHRVDGDHFTMFGEPGASQMAALMQAGDDAR